MTFAWRQPGLLLSSTLCPWGSSHCGPRSGLRAVGTHSFSLYQSPGQKLGIKMASKTQRSAKEAVGIPIAVLGSQGLSSGSRAVLPRDLG